MFVSAAKAADFTLDFDNDASGNPINFMGNPDLSVGNWEDIESTEINLQWFNDFGVTINAYEKPRYDKNTGYYNNSNLESAPYGAVLFNTDPGYYSNDSDARRSDGSFKGAFDTDLLTGEGYLNRIDSGASIQLGNVLIIQENPGRKQLDRTKTDDERRGGILAFDFKEVVDLTSIDLLDVSDDFGKRGKQIVFTAYGEMDEKLKTWMFDEEALVASSGTNDPISGTAERLSKQKRDNSLYRFNFDQTGVQRLEVLYPGSGAIAALRWQESQPPESIPEPAFAVGLLAIAGLGLRLKKRTDDAITN